MRKLKVYIAGKITGNPEYAAEFNEAAERLSDDDDAIILNPAILPEGMSERDYMQITMAMLMTADLAVFLPGYKESEGAMIEWKMCEKVGIPHIPLYE